MTHHRNLAEILRCQAERLGPRPAIRFKRQGLYHDVSWTQYRAEALACAAALVDGGIQPGDRVGLLGENRVEWLFADMGILTAGAVNVPPHAPLTARQIHFQMDDARVRWMFVSNAAQLDKIRQVRAELLGLQGVVVFDRDCAADDVILWDGFLQRGRQLLVSSSPLPQGGRGAGVRGELARREAAIGLEDLATIMYTSGTTGNPKGVMLTQGNLISNIYSCLQVAPVKIEDVTFCWLPLSHIYARTVDYYKCLAAGNTFCLAENAETIVENLAEIQPTHMSNVPRFYEKLLAAVGTPDPVETGKRLKHIFGPRMDWLGSGGAPLPQAVEDVLHAAKLPILPGYGLTESSPVISFNRKDKNRPGTVGPPIPGVEVKIASDGEILARGPNIMRGYWNNPEATAEALKDGWLYTGDLGTLDKDGFLKITGRKKELLVLSNGKKVVPNYIEALLLADDCIDQAVVHGEGKNFLTALLVPHWDNLRQAMRDNGTPVDGESEEVLARHSGILALLRARIDRLLTDVAGYEQVRKFIVLPYPFTVAADELTVSLKLRRNVVFSKYKNELDALYRE